MNVFSSLSYILSSWNWVLTSLFTRNFTVKLSVLNLEKLFVIFTKTSSLIQSLCFLYMFFNGELHRSTIVLEKAMAPHSSTLALKIPWTEEPGGLQSMGSLRVRHDWATSLHFTSLQLLTMFSIFSCTCWPSMCLLYSDHLPNFNKIAFFFFGYWVASPLSDM